MSGSVFKRCSSCGWLVRPRACPNCGSTKTTWYYRVFVGKDAKGKWIEERRGSFASRADAERALAEVVSSLNGGRHVRKDSTTLRAYLLEQWLPATAPPRVRPDTWQDRSRNLRLHVVPAVGDVPLQDLSAAHLNRLYSDLLVSGRADGQGGLSPTSVRRIHSMLRKALNDAVRWGIVARNVTQLADPPPQRLASAARRRSMRTWSAAELRRFLAATEADRWHPMWMVAASTGLRRSELLGLSWRDVDLDAPTLAVRATILLGEDGDYHLVEDQKSAVAGRTIHLDTRTVAALRTQRANVEDARRQVGPGWRDNDLVFPQADGRWRNPPAVSATFRRAIARAGVPTIRFHDLRHTHATLLLRTGVNPKVVSERLGHSSVAFTLDTYAHVVPGMAPEAADRFSDLIFAGDDAGPTAEEAS
jgi:integrase